MPAAYCLSCNEQVTETPAGTCPQGHTVTSRAEGPQPWVGHAGVGREPTAAGAETSWRDVDVAELQEAAVHTSHATLNGGAANGAPSNGAPSNGGPHVGRQPANGTASDELAAMLAEALSGSEHTVGTDTAAPVDEAPVDETPVVEQPPVVVDPPLVEGSFDGAPADDRGWEELANLAAELQLDDRQGPAGVPGEPARPPSAVEDLARTLGLDLDEPEDTVEAPPPPPPPPPPSDAVPMPAPPPTAADSPASWATALESAVEPSPGPDAGWEPSWDERAAVSAEETSWEPADSPEAPAAPGIDLTNFTARGTRVGGGSVPPGDAAPRRTRFGRKR